MNLHPLPNEIPARVALDLRITGIPILVRGNVRSWAVYCPADDGWLCLVGEGVATTWIATVNGRGAKGEAETVEAAALAIGRFWIEHRDDPPLRMDTNPREMGEYPGLEPLLEPEAVRPRLRDGDLRGMRVR